MSLFSKQSISIFKRIFVFILIATFLLGPEVCPADPALPRLVKAQNLAATIRPESIQVEIQESNPMLNDWLDFATVKQFSVKVRELLFLEVREEKLEQIFALPQITLPEVRRIIEPESGDVSDAVNKIRKTKKLKREQVIRKFFIEALNSHDKHSQRDFLNALGVLGEWEELIQFLKARTYLQKKENREDEEGPVELYTHRHLPKLLRESRRIKFEDLKSASSRKEVVRIVEAIGEAGKRAIEAKPFLLQLLIAFEKSIMVQTSIVKTLGKIGAADSVRDILMRRIPISDPSKNRLRILLRALREAQNLEVVIEILEEADKDFYIAVEYRRGNGVRLRSSDAWREPIMSDQESKRAQKKYWSAFTINWDFLGDLVMGIFRRPAESPAPKEAEKEVPEKIVQNPSNSIYRVLENIISETKPSLEDLKRILAVLRKKENKPHKRSLHKKAQELYILDLKESGTYEDLRELLTLPRWSREAQLGNELLIGDAIRAINRKLGGNLVPEEAYNRVYYQSA